MACLRVVTPGFQTTVQDLGRYGYAHLGVSASGAADALSLRLGNLLVGNAEDAAALEMTLVGGTFEFQGNVLVALTGSDFGPALDGVPLPLWASIEVKAGHRVSCGATKSGARCYLCVSGGIRVPPVLGSVSTHLVTGMGGHMGRALKKGDQLELGSPTAGPRRSRRLADDVLLRLKKEVIRLTAGPQADRYSREALEVLVSSAYLVTEESDRMGIRLRGNPILGHERGNMLTEGVSLGAIQVPHDGQPIILFVEHQTTGGYPKIANVISADMHVIGQLRPRDVVHFEFVSLRHALELLEEQENLINPESLVSCDD